MVFEQQYDMFGTKREATTRKREEPVGMYLGGKVKYREGVGGVESKNIVPINSEEC